MVAEGHEGTAVRWHRMISKVAVDHLRQPAPLDGDRLMHAPPQRVLDPPQGRPHAVGTTLPLELEGAPAGSPADVGEPQEAERLRFAEPALGAPVRREAAKRDQAGLVRMQRQRKLLQARAHRVPEAPGIGLVLEADHEWSSGVGLAPLRPPRTGRETLASSGSYTPSLRPHALPPQDEQVGIAAGDAPQPVHRRTLPAPEPRVLPLRPFPEMRLIHVTEHLTHRER